jgi:uncharacterized protein (TIGR03083 family)
MSQILATVHTSAMTLPPERWLDHLERECGRFSAVLADGDLAAPVPACPGWDLAALTGHLGGVHRWARDGVAEGRPTEEERPYPADRAPLRAWFDESAADLLATLRAAGPTAPCWHFGPAPRTAAFWFRRQAHETAMHARDAEEAAWGRRTPLDPELVADGIDEILTMFLPRQVRLGRLDPPAQVAELRATDTDAGPFRLAPAGDGELVGVVHAPAETLLLLLWRRHGVDAPGVRVEGDADRVRALLALPLTP